MTSFEEKYRAKNRPGAPSSMEVLKAAAAPEAPATAKDDYKAFYPQTQAQFDLWIRPNAANASPATSIPYSRRVNMTVDDGWFVIIMQFDSGPVQSVRLHGRNLEEVFMKLLGHEVVYVREFDPRIWPELPEGEACITGIDVRYRLEPRAKEEDDTLPGERQAPDKPASH